MITLGTLREVKEDYTIGCLLDCPCVKENYMLIAIDLSKKHKLDADPKAIRQISFNGNLNRPGQRFFSLLKKRKKPFYIFHMELTEYCNFIWF